MTNMSEDPTSISHHGRGIVSVLRFCLTFGLLFPAYCLLITPPAAASGQTSSQRKQAQLSAQEWREDLRFMAEHMRTLHKSLFHTVTEADLQQAIVKLDAEIPQLNADQIFVRFLQIIAMIQDGHSGINSRPFPVPENQGDHIPVRFERYDDGIYVRAAAAEYADAVG